MDPHLGKNNSGFAHKTNPHSPQTHRTVLVTVTVRVIINLTETLIIILSKITYLAVSRRISKHIYRTTDVIFELITKIWMLFSTMLTNSWTRYSWINEILFNGERIEVHIGHGQLLCVLNCYSRLTAILPDGAKPKVKMRHSWGNHYIIAQCCQ